jgi:hypothetical protein
MKKFIVTICPKIRMIDGRTSQGDYYQIDIEATDRASAIRKARAHHNKNKRPGEFGVTFKVWASA